MTTKNQMIAIVKSENPNGLQTGNDQEGYIPLTADEYEAQIAEWADARLAEESAKAQADSAKAQADSAKAAAQAKLAALGLTADDLKALGL